MALSIDRDDFPLAQPDFVWPNEGNRHPLAHAGARLVQEFARVGWDAPGFNVELAIRGSGRNLHRQVQRISGDLPEGPFVFTFGMHDVDRDGKAVAAGLSEIVIPPGIELVTYSDNSGPTAAIYVGRNWKADAKAFIEGFKTNAKLNGQRKSYLRYEASHLPRYRGILLHTNDLGREYDPEGAEPTALALIEIVAKVEAVVDRIIAQLIKLPSAELGGPDAGLSNLLPVTATPAPPDFPKLYAWVRDHRLHHLLSEPKGPEDDYALRGGTRLLRLGDRPRAKVDPIAYEGFIYASADPRARREHPMDSYDQSLPVEIKLSDLTDVYVVDASLYRDARLTAYARALARGKEEITERDIVDAMGAVAKSMVPVTEYTGGFLEPMHLIRRQLTRDEVRVLRGPIGVHEGANATQLVMTDEETGTEVLVQSVKLTPGCASHDIRVERILQLAEETLGPSIGQFRI
ncbi:conserved hypothetical protein [Hyphomicrobiales bacterium]|nr:conserved hypothetical protein [Hyphomicrobiales bacterium]CAH1702586.1 conserved hypothetical protein [Hyphomicrobiales bacterium]CAI0346789.1 conserved hypothetical protein [Hyphomicrobiales bacterium]